MPIMNVQRVKNDRTKYECGYITQLYILITAIFRAERQKKNKKAN